jgi:hypothetical protein
MNVLASRPGRFIPDTFWRRWTIGLPSVEETSAPCGEDQSHGCITIIYGVEKMPLPKTEIS